MKKCYSVEAECSIPAYQDAYFEAEFWLWKSLETSWAVLGSPMNQNTNFIQKDPSKKSPFELQNEHFAWTIHKKSILSLHVFLFKKNTDLLIFNEWSVRNCHFCKFIKIWTPLKFQKNGRILDNVVQFSRWAKILC